MTDTNTNTAATTPPPAAMTSEQMITRIRELRSKQINGDHLTDDELREAIQLLAATRGSRAKASNSKKEKAVASAFDPLKDF